MPKLTQTISTSREQLVFSAVLAKKFHSQKMSQSNPSSPHKYFRIHAAVDEAKGRKRSREGSILFTQFSRQTTQ